MRSFALFALVTFVNGGSASIVKGIEKGQHDYQRLQEEIQRLIQQRDSQPQNSAAINKKIHDMLKKMENHPAQDAFPEYSLKMNERSALVKSLPEVGEAVHLDKKTLPEKESRNIRLAQLRTGGYAANLPTSKEVQKMKAEKDIPRPYHKGGPGKDPYDEPFEEAASGMTIGFNDADQVLRIPQEGRFGWSSQAEEVSNQIIKDVKLLLSDKELQERLKEPGRDKELQDAPSTYPWNHMPLALDSHHTAQQREHIRDLSVHFKDGEFAKLKSLMTTTYSTLRATALDFLPTTTYPWKRSRPDGIQRTIEEEQLVYFVEALDQLKANFDIYWQNYSKHPSPELKKRVEGFKNQVENLQKLREEWQVKWEKALMQLYPAKRMPLVSEMANPASKR